MVQVEICGNQIENALIKNSVYDHWIFCTKYYDYNIQRQLSKEKRKLANVLTVDRKKVDFKCNPKGKPYFLYENPRWYKPKNGEFL